jgi:parallel beta-helix repeat protein
MRSRSVIFLLFFVVIKSYATVYFVAKNGNDTNLGTVDSPFSTIVKAVSKVVAGDTIYVRGGTYVSASSLSISKSGTAQSMIYLYAYPDEKVILDFTGTTSQGVKFTANYWHIKGFDIKNAGDNGMIMKSSGNNIIENCNFYDNKDSGLQLGTGSHDNTIINCDSYFNADPPDYGDADGFACKLDVGTNNKFVGCRSWLNCDDGWDGYMRGANDVSTYLENCWTAKNGYLKNGTDPGTQANGNGFKMGGSDDKTLRHNFTLKNCLAFENKAKGFDQNNNKGSMTLYNCTGYKNGTNYAIYLAIDSGKTAVVSNCNVLGPMGELATFVIQENNSWNLGITPTEADFQSIDSEEAFGPRKPDGSLPDIQYMHLAQSSPMIDAGVDVGLPFVGQKPDLGAWETNFDGPPVTYNINITKQGVGTGNVVISPADTIFAQGTMITITATPDEGNAFVNWSGDRSDSLASISFRIYSNIDLIANFEKTTFINTVKSRNSLTCYPSVTSGILNIRYNVSKPESNIMKVYDLMGNVIYSKLLNSFIVGQSSLSINLGNAKPGIYIVTLYNKDNILHQRIIKK